MHAEEIISAVGGLAEELSNKHLQLKQRRSVQELIGLQETGKDHALSKDHLHLESIGSECWKRPAGTKDTVDQYNESSTYEVGRPAWRSPQRHKPLVPADRGKLLGQGETAGGTSDGNVYGTAASHALERVQHGTSTLPFKCQQSSSLERSPATHQHEASTSSQARQQYESAMCSLARQPSTSSPVACQALNHACSRSHVETATSITAPFGIPAYYGDGPAAHQRYTRFSDDSAWSEPSETAAAPCVPARKAIGLMAAAHQRIAETADTAPTALSIDLAALVDKLGSADTAASLAAAEELTMLARSSPRHQSQIMLRGAALPLKRMLSNDKTALAATSALWALTKDNAANQAIAVDSNVIVRLVRMLGSSSSTLVYTAVNALLTLAANNPQRQQAFQEAGAIPMLVNVLQSGSYAARQAGAELILALATGNYVNQACIVKEKAIPHLVAMLTIPKSAQEDMGGCRAAISVIHELISGRNDSYIKSAIDAKCIAKLYALRDMHGCFPDLLAKPVNKDGVVKQGVNPTAVLDKLEKWEAKRMLPQVKVLRH